ncbi:hypothetical protein, partial [Thiocapsa sp. N5-Cardenillas]|uniref:hypothetical protein n=1 Tax=Thiocapsa sp. N5-Cardenillas TaxID=3137397 RepID=UPI0035B1E9D6
MIHKIKAMYDEGRGSSLRAIFCRSGVQVQEWVMIHKIKAMYDEGRGSSLRAIAAELKISRNT